MLFVVSCARAFAAGQKEVKWLRSRIPEATLSRLSFPSLFVVACEANTHIPTHPKEDAKDGGIMPFAWLLVSACSGVPAPCRSMNVH